MRQLKRPLIFIALLTLLGCSGEYSNGRSPASLYNPNANIDANGIKGSGTTESKSDKQGLTNHGSPLKSIKLKEGLQELPAGTRTGWVALGIYEDLSTRIVSDLVKWSVTDDTKATLTKNPPGTLLTKLGGKFDLVASLGDISGRITINVSDAYIISMSLILEEDQIPVGGNGTFVRAEGRFSDNQRYDVTPGVTFSSAMRNTADVNNSDEKKGFIRGRSSGSTKITGIYSPEISASTFVQVTGVKPWSLHIMGHANEDDMPACISKESPPQPPDRKYKDINKYVKGDKFTGFARVYHSNCDYTSASGITWDIISGGNGMGDFGDGPLNSNELNLSKIGDVIVRASLGELRSNDYKISVEELTILRLFLAGQSDGLDNADFSHCRSKPGNPAGDDPNMKVDDPDNGTKDLRLHLIKNNCEVSLYVDSPNIRWQSSDPDLADFQRGNIPNRVTAVAAGEPKVWAELMTDSQIRSGDFQLIIEAADPDSGG